MPATPTGTAYTISSTTLSPHGDCYWGVADAHAADANLRTVLFAHGSGGAANNLSTGSSWAGIREWLVDNGWAWIEGTGGITENWGNQQARDAYPAYLDHVSEILDLGDVVLLGRSMGGLVSSWLYAKSGIPFAGWMNNSAVGTMKIGGTVENPDAGEYYTTARKFRTGVGPAYGLTGWESGFTWIDSIPTDFCPETWPASVWAGKKILTCYGDLDTTVPLNPRGVGPLRTIWAGQPAIDQLSIRVGGDHSGSNGANLNVADMADFLTTVTGGVVAPPAPRTYQLIEESYVYRNGLLYPTMPNPLDPA